MLIYLLVIVVLLLFLRKEGLTTYLKYKEIPKDNINSSNSNIDGETYVSPETDCIYTQIPPQVEKVYNIDFDSPFDRYNTLNIDSDYNISYYDDTPLDISFDIAKQESDNLFPFYKAYRYCDLKDMQPTCTYLTCGINEEISETRTVRGRQRINVVSHNKEVANILNRKKSEVKPNAINDLSTQRTNLSNAYKQNNNYTNTYLNSIKDI